MSRTHWRNLVKYEISRERIRQIETKAFEKLQKSMINSSKSKTCCL